MVTARTTTTAGARDLTAEVVFLTRALKAPTLRESVARLAERARAETWSHEEFLVACLQREVSARESHGGEGRIRAARFPARKSLEEFDFDHARSLKRDSIAHLGWQSPETVETSGSGILVCGCAARRGGQALACPRCGACEGSQRLRGQGRP
jgi:DNA replication protein DnaC